MIIKDALHTPTEPLRELWKQVFGDSEDFLDLFYSTAFHPARCRYVETDGAVSAALYWLDCTCRGRKLAYIYGVATAEKYRGRGLCRTLMADTHRVLAERDYSGAILVPGEPGLFRMYEKMGYQTCCGIREIHCVPGGEELPLTTVDARTYQRLRGRLLPEGGVLQEGENLAFLEALGEFYAGQELCLWISRGGDGTVTGEWLGDETRMPAAVKALGAARGSFRTPGSDRPFALYHPLDDAPAPTYFGFAFD